MSSSLVNNRHYGNVFPFVRLALDREIQGLSFIVWCDCRDFVCFVCSVIFSIGQRMTRNDEIL